MVNFRLTFRRVEYLLAVAFLIAFIAFWQWVYGSGKGKGLRIAVLLYLVLGILILVGSCLGHGTAVGATPLLN